MGVRSGFDCGIVADLPDDKIHFGAGRENGGDGLALFVSEERGADRRLVRNGTELFVRQGVGLIGADDAVFLFRAAAVDDDAGTDADSRIVDRLFRVQGGVGDLLLEFGDLVIELLLLFLRLGVFAVLRSP